MHPYLFDWVVNGHHFRPPTYGILLALAFSAGYFECLRRAAKLEEETKHIENLFLLVVVGSVVGARLFHVVFEEFEYYQHHPLKIFAVWEGGYTFYGALLMSMLFMYFYARARKLNYLQYLDIATPATALGLFLGRLGCFFAGCCWGRPTTSFLGVTFSNPEAFITDHHTPLHPTQLYESFGSLAIFVYTMWRFRDRKYKGEIFFHGMIAYCVLRFLVEFFRGDDYRGYVLAGSLSYAQLVSLFIMPFAIVGMFIYSKDKKSSLRN